MTEPQVDEVAAGVWSIPVPIPGSTLGHVFVYALVGDGDVVLVDAGWDHPESREALRAGLATAGAGLEDVTGIAVTHVHADHFGLAGWIREHGDAWVGLHPADAALVHDRYTDPSELLERTGRWLRQTGVPNEEVERLRDASLEILGTVHATPVDRDLTDGELLDTPAGRVGIVHTPGHTPGHVCLDLPSANVVFTGDHVLPRISPNVGWHPQSDPDPLGDYLDALVRVQELGVRKGLPGHGHILNDPAERAAEIRDHHADELDAVAAALDAGAGTAWEVARLLSWSRPWAEIEPFFQRAAIAEVCAHLIRLEQAGRAERVAETPLRWARTSPTS